MKWRKILAAGMGLVLAAGLMSGCGDQKKETGSRALPAIHGTESN